MKKYFIIPIVILSLFFTWACNNQNKSDNKNDKEIIKIGAILPLTGPLSVLGIPEKNILEYSIDYLNSNQTKYKYELLEPIDSKGQSKEAVSGIIKLNNERVDIVFATLTNIAISIAEPTSKNNIPVFANSMLTDLTKKGKNLFRFFPSTKNETDFWVSQIISSNVSKVGFLYINTDYASEEKNILADTLSKHSITFVSESFNFGDKDFKNQLIKLKEEKIEELIISGLGLNYITIVNQIKQLNMNISILGDFDFGLPLARNEALKFSNNYSAYEGIVFPMFNIDESNQKLKLLRTKFKSRFNYDILDDPEALFYFDALMLVDSLNQVNNQFNRTKLISSLKNITNYNGVTGSFDIINRSANMPMRKAVFSVDSILLK